MKRKICALLALLMITVMLTSCGVEGYPKIREERFDFSVTYEEWGEQKTISGVYVCKFAGYEFTLEGGDFVRSWEGHIEGVEGAGDEYNSAVRKSLRDNDPRMREAAQAYIDGNYSLYNALRDEISKEGIFDYKLITDALKAEINYLKIKAEEAEE